MHLAGALADCLLTRLDRCARNRTFYKNWPLLPLHPDTNPEYAWSVNNKNLTFPPAQIQVRSAVMAKSRASAAAFVGRPHLGYQVGSGVFLHNRVAWLPSSDWLRRREPLPGHPLQPHPQEVCALSVNLHAKSISQSRVKCYLCSAAPVLVSVDWGPWGEVGMAKVGTRAHKLSLQHGEVPLPSGAAIAALATALRDALADGETSHFMVCPTRRALRTNGCRCRSSRCSRE